MASLASRSAAHSLRGSHTYAHVGGRIPIVDEQGNVRPYIWQARKRGIIFDVGHGGGSFL